VHVYYLGCRGPSGPKTKNKKEKGGFIIKEKKKEGRKARRTTRPFKGEESFDPQCVAGELIPGEESLPLYPGEENKREDSDYRDFRPSSLPVLPKRRAGKEGPTERPIVRVCA